MNSLKKIWLLLTQHQRRKSIMLLVLMLIGMVLETLGISLVIPALGLLSQNDLASSYPSMASLMKYFGSPSHEELVIAGMLILVGVYTLKTVFLVFLTWRQARFVYEVQAGLSYNLFKGYLKQPYAFHLQRNSAELIRNTIGQVTDLTSVMQQGLVLITELLVLFGISILLLAVEPIGALIVISVLALAGLGGHVLTRNKTLKWGEARQLHEGKRIQHLQQGLGGAKDVKLLGREAHFLEQYDLHNMGSARVGERQVTLKALPRLGLELLAVFGLSALVLTMIAQGRPLNELLPIIGVFGAAAFRLLPSVNRIVMAIQGVRFYLPVIDTISQEFLLIDNINQEKQTSRFPFQKMLSINNVTYSYTVSENTVLHDISLKIPRGASVGFIGGSGAGKSTLVDIILGLLTPNAGSVDVDDINVQSNIRGWQNQIGYVPQSIFLTDDTLRRNVAFGIPENQIDDTAVEHAIHSAQLEKFINDLPQGLETPVGERGVRLSGGQRQRIGIARALYHDPEVLVFDEATSSLDIDTEKSFMQAVRALQGDKTIIIVAHRLSTVEHCDHLFRLEKGRIVEEGTAVSVLSGNS